MGRVAAIGEEALVRGFGLAGVLVLAAEDDDAVRRRWTELPGDIEVVILTAMAGRAQPAPADGPLRAVLP